ncbi:hypothetical protein AB0G74_19985 [Streptomyces sp. NPDC020875]|uniref:hypothetical protein n=1 Tax=Streptomyces sp. NPDC020875 TaxID=3154898 RepID=UPI0033D15555
MDGDDGGTAPYEVHHGPEHGPLAPGVETGRRLVEQDDGRAPEDGPGEGDPPGPGR